MGAHDTQDSGIRRLKGKHLNPIQDYVDGLHADATDDMFGDRFDTLVDKLAVTYSHCMLPSNVSHVLYMTVLEHQMEQGYYQSEQMGTDWPAARQHLINKIKTSFEKYPANYEVRISLPSFQKPSKAMRIELAPDMWLDFRVQPGQSGDWSLVLAGRGYLDNRLNSPLGFKILSKAKLFVFFIRSLNLVQIKTYSKGAHGEIRDLQASEEQREQITMPNGLSHCFGGLALHLGTLVRPRGEPVLKLSVMFDNLRDEVARLRSLIASAAMDDSVATAIEWFEDSHFAENETVAFLLVCIGFEALLQDPDHHLKDMTNRLCDRLAFSLANSRAERKAISDEYRAILELRGQLVHSKQARIHDNQRAHLHNARKMLKRLIDSELKLVSGEAL